MCSRKEQRRLHVLEVSTVAHVNSDKAVPVKEFIRSGAGHVTPTPSDLRPLSVLVDAITYLITRYYAKNSTKTLPHHAFGVLPYKAIFTSQYQPHHA